MVIQVHSRAQRCSFYPSILIMFVGRWEPVPCHVTITTNNMITLLSSNYLCHLIVIFIDHYPYHNNHICYTLIYNVTYWQGVPQLNVAIWSSLSYFLFPPKVSCRLRYHLSECSLFFFFERVLIVGTSNKWPLPILCLFTSFLGLTTSNSLLILINHIWPHSKTKRYIKSMLLKVLQFLLHVYYKLTR